MSAIYFVDTSEWINLNRRYPDDGFPNLWSNVENLISKERILAPREVFDEIERGHDELVEWCKTHQKMFRDTSALTGQVQKIIRDHPTLVNRNATYESADPYIIALAASYKHDISGLVPIIVTDENVSKESHIPYVARANGVQTCKLAEMFQREGWQP